MSLAATLSFNIAKDHFQKNLPSGSICAAKELRKLESQFHKLVWSSIDDFRP